MKHSRYMRAILKKVLGTKNEKKNENLWLSTFLKKTLHQYHYKEIQVLQNSTLHHKISRLGGGGFLQRLLVKIASSIRYTITQSHC